MKYKIVRVGTHFHLNLRVIGKMKKLVTNNVMSLSLYTVNS